ncbi:hypothetical protein BDD12DRAFT_931838 [Trichophaea hybrida]|nr:hypothetical protein BDD12DRAFT_931838 [Trichophaea hybrida]
MYRFHPSVSYTREYPKREDIVKQIKGVWKRYRIPPVPGIDSFGGVKVHSSQLDGVDVRGKDVAVVGGGASAIEVLGFAAANGAKMVHLLSRFDKWIIPRNPIIDILLSHNIFGAEMYTSYIPEFLLRRFFYRDLADLAPAKEGLWESTPLVNDSVFDQIRDGKAQWLRSDIEKVTKDGIHYNLRARGVPKVVLATPPSSPQGWGRAPVV